MPQMRPKLQYKGAKLPIELDFETNHGPSPSPKERLREGMINSHCDFQIQISNILRMWRRKELFYLSWEKIEGRGGEGRIVTAQIYINAGNLVKL